MATEKRNLIDRDELVEYLRDRMSVVYPNLFPGLFAAIDYVEESPTVDAEPVRPGHWIARVDNDTPMHECSECGARVVKGLYEYENPNLYCYHCGAKMDGGAGNA